MGYEWQQLDRKNMNLYLAPISMFNDNDLMVLEGTGKQYILTNGKLIEVSDTSDHSDKMSELKDKRFSKISSTMPQPNLVELARERNRVALDHLKVVYEIEDSKYDKYSRMNRSTDLETLILISNILKVQYNVVV